METVTQVEYLKETQLRNAVRKVIGSGLHKKSDSRILWMAIEEGFKADFSNSSFRNQDNDAVWFRLFFGRNSPKEHYLQTLTEAGFTIIERTMNVYGSQMNVRLISKIAK